jgi:hypothetical protein
MLSPIFHPASGLWLLGKIEEHTAKPLSREEIEAHIMREIALRAEVETLSKRCAAVTKIADRLLTDLENVVEGLDPEEAAKVVEMRAIIQG